MGLPNFSTQGLEVGSILDHSTTSPQLGVLTQLNALLNNLIIVIFHNSGEVERNRLN